MPAPRIRVSVGYTFPTGSYASRRIDLAYEGDVESHYLVELHAIRLQLEGEAEDFKAQYKGAPALPTASSTALPTTVLPKPVPSPVTTEILTDQGTIASVTEQMIEAELDQVNWIDNSKRTGWFAPLIEIPQPIRDALINKFLANQGNSVKIRGYAYTRFGNDQRLIGKFPIKWIKQ